MPRIAAVAHSVPPHEVPQQVVREFAVRLFGDELQDPGRLRSVFDNSRVEHRRFMMPLEWYGSPRGFAESNRIFVQEGFALVGHAVSLCLEKAGLPAVAVDQIIFVTSTGHATPTMDAHVINTFGFPSRTSRLPIWGLGCAGGAAGLARAVDYCRAYPRGRVLVIALECCSLSFMPEEISKKNVVAASLFSDGCAAVLVAGDDTGTRGPAVTATASHLFPDSYRIMGWDFTDQGMNLVLSPLLPALVKQQLAGLLDPFLRSQRVRRQDLIHFIAHPGGARVIDALRKSLELEGSQLHATEDVLRRFGNMSSVSVLMVLEQWLSSEESSRRGHGLLVAFGPGFSAEMLLLEV